MIDRSNEIFSRVKDAVHLRCTNVSQTYQEIPGQFPHVFVDAKDAPVTNMDLENNECSVNQTVEITVYTTDDLVSAKEISELADTEMRNMGFQRTLGPQQVITAVNAGMIRVITRYQRLISDGDEL